MSDYDFGAPVAVDVLPPASVKGGRKSATPALEAWLKQLEPGKTYELASKEKDGAHPLSRVTQLRKLAGDAFKVETRPVVSGKRYRIFATVATTEANGTKAAKATPAK